MIAIVDFLASDYQWTMLSEQDLCVYCQSDLKHFSSWDNICLLYFRGVVWKLKLLGETRNMKCKCTKYKCAPSNTQCAHDALHQRLLRVCCCSKLCESVGFLQSLRLLNSKAVCFHLCNVFHNLVQKCSLPDCLHFCLSNDFSVSVYGCCTHFLIFLLARLPWDPCPCYPRWVRAGLLCLNSLILPTMN